MRIFAIVIICLLPLAGVGQDRHIDSLNYEASIKPVKDNQKSLQAEYSAKAKALGNEWVKINKEYYKCHPDSEFGLGVFANVLQYEKNPKILENDFDRFSARVKATQLGKSLQQRISAMINTELGVTAMGFTQNDVNGKPVSLSDFRGKYVLLDFWASWCKPCRAENPHVVKTFNAFKDKGFTVLSVSLDSKREAWIEAIEKDGMPWYHVSDLKGWNNEVAKLYGIGSIPQNFLIDPDGKIVAKNLRGEELIKKVGELIGIDKKL